MKIFIDTADLSEITQAVSWGIVDGATTNPSLIKKAVEKSKDISMKNYIKKIVKIVPGPVSLEVLGGNSNEMADQGRKLFNTFSPYGEIVIKIPVNPSLKKGDGLEFEGLKAIKLLSSEEIPVNVTLIMKPEQALLAAKVGASYVSPFAGRIDDYIRSQMGMEYVKSDYYDYNLLNTARFTKIHEEFKKHDPLSNIPTSKEFINISGLGRDNGIISGVDLVKSILIILKEYSFKTQVIAASIRNSRQVREVAELGVHISTLPFYVIDNMIEHYKTYEGMRKFTDDIVPSYKDIF